MMGPRLIASNNPPTAECGRKRSRSSPGAACNGKRKTSIHPCEHKGNLITAGCSNTHTLARTHTYTQTDTDHTPGLFSNTEGEATGTQRL